MRRTGPLPRGCFRVVWGIPLCLWVSVCVAKSFLVRYCGASYFVFVNMLSNVVVMIVIMLGTLVSVVLPSASISFS